jgi:3-hydroxybutyryl-CoA dehydrogenase
VIGAGTMGRGIAGLCALSGHDTFVFDADPEAQRGVRTHVESAWGRAIDKGKLSTESAEKARHRLKVATRLKEAASVDFVIEAVPEAIDLKQMVFAELDDLCPPRTILASNTSPCPSRGSRRPRGAATESSVSTFSTLARAAGEIVRAGTSGDRGPASSWSGRSAGGRPSPFPFRDLAPGRRAGAEAMRMVERSQRRGHRRALELGYGHRMGPLKTTDLVGLDVRLAIAETLAAELPSDRFTPPDILRTLVEEGRHGKKSGEGFYRWDGDKPVGPASRAAPLAKRR